MSLDGVEFLRRFLLRVLPRGFVRIRSYGLLANCCRREKIALCRSLIDRAAVGVDDDGRGTRADSQLAGVRCPECGLGVMVTIEIFRPYSSRLSSLLATLDSS